MSQRQSFLRELDDRLYVEGLHPELRLAVLAETQGHLEESIQARLEYGSGEVTAEAEAIAAFGLAKSHATAIADAFLPTRRALLRPVRVLGSLSCLAASVGMLSGSLVLLKPAMWLALVLGLGVAAASYRARRLDVAGLMSTGFLATLLLWVAMPLLWVSSTPYGGYANYPRWQTESTKRKVALYAEEAAAQAAFLRNATAAFATPGQDTLTTAGRLGLLTAGGFVRVPSQTGGSTSASVQYREIGASDAAVWWTRTGEAMASGLDSDAAARLEEVKALRRAEAAPYGEQLATMRDMAAPVAPIFICTLVLFGALGSGLGLAVRQIRWIRRRTRIV